MSDPLKIKQYIRTVNDFPIDGIKFRELTRISKSFDATSIASIESRGFIFAGSIAKDLSLPFILARKPGKLPNETFMKDFDLEYGSTSIEIQKNTVVNE